MWALDDFTEENGATEIIPGSHRFGPGEVPAHDDARRFKAIMPAGFVLIWQGTLFDRGGANRTDAPRHQTATLPALATADREHGPRGPT